MKVHIKYIRAFVQAIQSVEFEFNLSSNTFFLKHSRSAMFKEKDVEPILLSSSNNLQDI